MARHRTVKPELYSDEKLWEVSRDCRLLFIGLFNFADDMGRKAYAPKRIKMEIFPGDEDVTPKQVSVWIRQLEQAHVLKSYEVDGHSYLWIPGFLRDQKIDKPGHSSNPPHPQDPDPDCKCWQCKAIRDGKIHVSAGIRRLVDDSTNTHRTVDEHSTTIRNGSNRGGLSKSGVTVRENQNQTDTDFQQQNSDQQPPDTRAENRRTEYRALEEIATRMLRLLELKPNSQLLQTVTKSVTVKARSKECSIEAAAQQIAARAAFVAAENPPENWEQWFADVAYEYVAVKDPRLKDRHIEARPVCGGSRCEDGWERVQVNGSAVLRRCPDCAKLWADLGV